jgi:putative redox protein
MSATLQVLVEQIGPSTSKVTVRSHSVLVDRPEPKGGADRGPLGGEYLLVALGGCFTSHLLAAIKARDSAVQGVRVTVRGTLDGSPERFTSLALDVSARTDDAELLRKLVTMAERSCQVTNTLRGIVPIETTVRSDASTLAP